MVQLEFKGGSDKFEIKPNVPTGLWKKENSNNVIVDNGQKSYSVGKSEFVSELDERSKPRYIFRLNKKDERTIRLKVNGSDHPVIIDKTTIGRNAEVDIKSDTKIQIGKFKFKVTFNRITNKEQLKESDYNLR